VSILNRRGEQRQIDFGRWAEVIETRKTQSGEDVTFETATSLASVHRAVSLLADFMSTLPVDVFRTGPDGVPVEVERPSQLVTNPSLVVSPRVWRYQLAVSWLIWGNAYGLVLTRDREGHPTTVEWVDPTSVEVDEPSSLRPPSFRLNGQPVNPNDFLHVPGKYVRPGSAIGVAPLDRHKETIGLGLATRRFGADWFDSGAHPSGILKTEQVLSPEQAATIKSRFSRLLGKKREVVALGAGVDYSKVQTAPDESQFIETASASVADIARAFDLPIETLGGAASGSSVTYANREQRAIDMLTMGVDPWLVVLENDVYTDNLPPGQYSKVNRGALLRADAPTRWRIHDQAIRAGLASVNERRRLEDLPPIPDGDEYLWPPYRAFPIESDSDE